MWGRGEGGEGGEKWENFCEQKFSQTLSKNFTLVIHRERRMTTSLKLSMVLSFVFPPLTFLLIFQSKFFERVWENFCSQKFSQFPSQLSFSLTFFFTLFLVIFFLLPLENPSIIVRRLCIFKRNLFS